MADPLEHRGSGRRKSRPSSVSSAGSANSPILVPRGRSRRKSRPGSLSVAAGAGLSDHGAGLATSGDGSRSPSAPGSPVITGGKTRRKSRGSHGLSQSSAHDSASTSLANSFSAGAAESGALTPKSERRRTKQAEEIIAREGVVLMARDRAEEYQKGVETDWQWLEFVVKIEPGKAIHLHCPATGEKQKIPLSAVLAVRVALDDTDEADDSSASASNSRHNSPRSARSAASRSPSPRAAAADGDAANTDAAAASSPPKESFRARARRRLSPRLPARNKKNRSSGTSTPVPELVRPATGAKRRFMLELVTRRDIVPMALLDEDERDDWILVFEFALQEYRRKQHQSGAIGQALAGALEATNVPRYQDMDGSSKVTPAAPAPAPSSASPSSNPKEMVPRRETVRHALRQMLNLDGTAEGEPAPLPGGSRRRDLEWVADVLVSKGDPETYYKLTDERLGRGGFGEVFVGKDRATNRKVAVKIMEVSERNRPHFLYIETELQAKSGGHENIVQFLDSFYVRPRREFWIVMEYIKGGNLEAFIWLKEFREKHAAYVTHRVLRGLRHIHHGHRVHRDIKLGNILIGDGGVVKLTDFGLAAQLTETRDQRQSFVGTPDLAAPEVARCTPYGVKVDIWGLGMVILKMAHQQAFPNSITREGLIKQVSREGPPRLSGKKFSSDMKDFVALCAQLRPEKRPNAADLLDHPWLKHECTVNEMQSLVDIVNNSSKGSGCVLQ